jgi:hypothetical protein
MAVSWLLRIRVRHKVKYKIENEAKHTVSTSHYTNREAIIQ